MLGIWITSSNVALSVFVGISTPIDESLNVRIPPPSALKVVETFFRGYLKNVNPASLTLSRTAFRQDVIGSLSFNASLVDMTVNGLPVSINASTRAAIRYDGALRKNVTKGNSLSNTNLLT